MVANVDKSIHRLSVMEKLNAAVAVAVYMCPMFISIQIQSHMNESSKIMRQLAGSIYCTTRRIMARQRELLAACTRRRQVFTTNNHDNRIYQAPPGLSESRLFVVYLNTGNHYNFELMLLVKLGVMVFRSVFKC